MKALILIVISLFLLAGAYADTATGRVGITTAAPGITINNPTANSWHNSSFTVNASVSGTAIAATYRWENSSTNGSYTSLAHQGSGIWTNTFSITSVADGNYTLRVNASNEANTTDVETAFIYIDDTNPVVSSFALTKTGTILQGSTLTSSDFSCSATDNSESFGGAVSTVITGISTETAGSKTATCTATDSASNTATATASYTVSLGGATGGGGGTVVTNESAATNITQQETAIVTAPEAIKEISIVPTDLDTISRIILSLSGGLSAAVIDVKTFTEPPAGTSSVGKAVYRYLEINTDAPAGTIQGAKIQFKVEKSWIEQQQAAPDSVILMHHKGGKWQELSTARTNEDANFYHYEAQTDSLSLFAIAARARSFGDSNLITGGAISIPAIPVSTDTVVLGLMGLVLVLVIFFARRNTSRAKNKRVKPYKRW